MRKVINKIRNGFLSGSMVAIALITVSAAIYIIWKEVHPSMAIFIIMAIVAVIGKIVTDDGPSDVY